MAVMTTQTLFRPESFPFSSPNYHKMTFCFNSADLRNQTKRRIQIKEPIAKTELREYSCTIPLRFPTFLLSRIHIVQPKVAYSIMISVPTKLSEQIFWRLSLCISRLISRVILHGRFPENLRKRNRRILVKGRGSPIKAAYRFRSIQLTTKLWNLKLR